MGVAALMLFVLLSKTFPDAKFFNRVKHGKVELKILQPINLDEDDYQIEKAKIAISNRWNSQATQEKCSEKLLPQSVFRFYLRHYCRRIRFNRRNRNSSVVFIVVF